MTDEDRQRQMDFILDQQARLASTMSLLAESHARDSERITRDRARIDRLEESFVILTKLAESYGERIGGVEESVAELKRLTGSGGGTIQP
jgi:hypothetical protein